MIVIKIILIKNVLDKVRQKWGGIAKFIVDCILKTIDKKQQKKEVKILWNISLIMKM